MKNSQYDPWSLHLSEFLGLLIHLVQSPADDSNLRSEHGQTRQNDGQHQGLFQLVGGCEGIGCRGVPLRWGEWLNTQKT